MLAKLLHGLKSAPMGIAPTRPRIGSRRSGLVGAGHLLLSTLKLVRMGGRKGSPLPRYDEPTPVGLIEEIPCGYLSPGEGTLSGREVSLFGGQVCPASSRPLRIAMTTCDDVFGAGGVGNSIVRIARGLSAHYNALVDIIMLNPSEQTEFNSHGKNGITQLDQQIDAVSFFKLASWTGSTSTPQHWVDIHHALLELAEERQYDLLHAFYASITGFPTVYAACELNLPSVVSIRGNDINRDVFHTGRFHHLKWALENATQITAVSQEGLHRARIVSACPEKGRIILNSIRPEDFAEGALDLQLPRPVIGSLAVFKNKKGLEVLLCAFNMLLQHYPSAHLLLVGYVIPEEQSRFEELVAGYNLGDRITLTGRLPRHQVLRYLRNIDIFVFSSLHDGCPNAVLEAMLAGLPIVATCCGALPEMIEEGKQGFLVRPGSAMELSETVVRMLRADTDRWQYAQQARIRALSQFGPHKELEAYWEVYQRCFPTQGDRKGSPLPRHDEPSP